MNWKQLFVLTGALIVTQVACMFEVRSGLREIVFRLIDIDLNTKYTAEYIWNSMTPAARDEQIKQWERQRAESASLPGK